MARLTILNSQLIASVIARAFFKKRFDRLVMIRLGMADRLITCRLVEQFVQRTILTGAHKLLSKPYGMRWISGNDCGKCLRAFN